MNISTIILQKLQTFVNRFSSVDKPRRKWLCDMISGMIKSKSVILSQIAHELSDTTDKHHTEKRLDYNLRCESWEISDLQQSHLASVSCRIKKDTPIAFDFGDISKEHVSHLEYPCEVYDGSEHEVSLGYWLIGATAILSKSKQQPLIFPAFSTEAPDYLSNNKERENLISTVFDATEGRGIAVIDRGGDDRKLYDDFIQKKRRFVIRQMVNRDIVYQGVKQSMESLVDSMPLMYCQKRPGKKGYWTLRYGLRKVYLPKSLEPLYLVVAKAENRKENMVLLTNIPMKVAEVLSISEFS